MVDERLSPHFTLAELTASTLADRRGIVNAPGPDAVANLRRLAATLEQVREVLGHPVVVTSGYRSPELNKAIGGSSDSAHMFGRAADFKCPGFGTPLDVCREIVAAGIRFDQLIHEGAWVHLGIPTEKGPWRREILSARFHGGKTTYLWGLS